MPVEVGKVEPPKGIMRLLWRAPIWIYHLGLGGLMGGRFLLLNHTGRVSGLSRQTVLEVTNHDAKTNTYYVAAGFGKKSDWYQNIQKIPEVMIQVGRDKMPVTAVILEPEESGKEMVDYAHRYPRAARELMRICGYKVDGSDDDYYFLGREYVPFVALIPRES